MFALNYTYASAEDERKSVHRDVSRIGFPWRLERLSGAHASEPHSLSSQECLGSEVLWMKTPSAEQLGIWD
ncbi:hypothetical protein AALO_G00229060 [Alosa alosa]|uniref:Uncharacterized protein n=1 Tax=Alosa alosa TaxID=278164 RepID=A0AAV6FX43_9TELE|nr:hypothetical protein AALO_G00229060 [Alosa alosa]